MPDFDYMRKELQKNGVTKKLLWAEYLEECKQSGIVPYTFTSGFFSPNFSLSVSQISPRSLPCFSMFLMVL